MKDIGTLPQDEDIHVIDPVKEAINTDGDLYISAKEQKEEDIPVEIIDYLDSSILDVKIVTEEDLSQYENEQIATR